MKSLVIKSTNVSPSVVFQSNGRLKIEGKIITENAVITFEPIFNWLKNIKKKSIHFDIILEYINTSASMQLYALLNLLDDDDAIEEINVNWFYEEDDEEHLETGELFQERLEKTHFNYILINNEAA